MSGDWISERRQRAEAEAAQQVHAVEQAELQQRRLSTDGPAYWEAFLERVDYFRLRANEEFSGLNLKWADISGTQAGDFGRRLTSGISAGRTDFRYQRHDQKIRIFRNDEAIGEWPFTWGRAGICVLTHGQEMTAEQLARHIIEPHVEQAAQAARR